MIYVRWHAISDCLLTLGNAHGESERVLIDLASSCAVKSKKQEGKSMAHGNKSGAKDKKTLLAAPAATVHVFPRIALLSGLPGEHFAQCPWLCYGAAALKPTIFERARSTQA